MEYFDTNSFEMPQELDILLDKVQNRLSIRDASKFVDVATDAEIIYALYLMSKDEDDKEAKSARSRFTESSIAEYFSDDATFCEKESGLTLYEHALLAAVDIQNAEKHLLALQHGIAEDVRMSNATQERLEELWLYHKFGASFFEARAEDDAFERKMNEQINDPRGR